MTIFFAVLLIIYAAGCTAAIVECAEQYAEATDTSPAQRLRHHHPIVAAFAMSAIVIGWPLFLIWYLVRETLR